jgi:hypothetical protein
MVGNQLARQQRKGTFLGIAKEAGNGHKFFSEGKQIDSIPIIFTQPPVAAFAADRSTIFKNMRKINFAFTKCSFVFPYIVECVSEWILDFYILLEKERMPPSKWMPLLFSLVSLSS